MEQNFNPIPAMISTVSFITIEALRNFDSILSHGIQYAIGVLTIIYLIKKIKQSKNNDTGSN